MILKKVLTNSLLALTCFLSITALSGCLVRTYSVVKDRVDQDTQGNKGYLKGTPSNVSETAERKKTRQIQVVEIELRSPVEVKELNSAPEDKTATGNKGYVMGQEEQVVAGAPSEAIEPTPATTTPKMDTYKVKKGDTLEKIAAKKEIYGDYKKWKKIYEANKDKLKAADKIYVGQVLKIPHD